MRSFNARRPVHASRSVAGLLAFALSLTFMAPAVAKDSLIVVTGYPESFTQLFVQAFAQKHPDIDVELQHKSGGAALAALSAPDHGGADVYWAASSNFDKLATRDAFAPLSLDAGALSGRLGPEVFADAQNRYAAFELAGYGLAYAPQAAWVGKPAPTGWADAAAADLEGKIIMPIAAKVGFASTLYEIILQSEGWENGWALLSAIAGNAVLTASPHDLDPLLAGKAALALTIDFIALNAKAKGAPLSVAYPQRTAFLPAYVALLKGAPHAQPAAEFIAFLLSQDGQKLLLTPGIDRYPVRPDAYPAAGKFNPFTLPETLFAPFDGFRADARRTLDAILFDQAFVAPHDALVALWHKIHQAEAALNAHADAGKAGKLAEARRLAGFVPVSELEANDPSFLARFGKGGKVPDDVVAKWTGDLAAARAKADALLADIAKD